MTPPTHCPFCQTKLCYSEIYKVVECNNDPCAVACNYYHTAHLALFFYNKLYCGVSWGTNIIYICHGGMELKLQIDNLNDLKSKLNLILTFL